MKRYLLSILLITSQLFALEIVQLKVKHNNEFTQVKLMIKTPMRGEKVANRKKLEQDYITRIILESNQHVIFNAFTSSNISRNPYFKFQFKNNIYDGNIKFIMVDNNNKITEKLFIKNKKSNTLNTTIDSNELLKNDGFLISKKLWKLTNINEAIKELYGKVEFTYGNALVVNLPRSTENFFSINIKSDLNIESIAIFHNNHTYTASTIAVLKIPASAIVNYDIPIQMPHGCDINIVVVAKGKDETIYRKDNLIDVFGGDIGCDGSSMQ